VNLQYLQELYTHHNANKLLANGIQLSNPQIFNLKNLSASASSFLFSAFFSANNYNHLIIQDDYETAAYMHNDIEQITDALDICYFPDSFKHQDDYSKLNSSHVMLRSETLLKLQPEEGKSVHKKVLVSYPEALFEKVVDANAFGRNILLIKKNQEVDIGFLSEFLVGLGFVKEEFAFEPGQFAIRGGIVDIYSFGNEHPYRIELFDTEVESIRLFDPASQLSLKQLLQVKIVPNVQHDFDDASRMNLLEYLPENTIIWVNDLALVKERLQTQLAKYNSLVAKETSEVLLEASHKIDIENFFSLLSKRNIVDVGTNNTAQFVSQSLTETIDCKIKPQPAFNRNFDFLIDHFNQKAGEMYKIFICAENTKQTARIQSIFEDKGHNIIFTALPISVSGGFIDEDLKIICYTDHEIFQRYHKYKVKQAYSKGKAMTMRTLNELTPGDFISHIDHGVGMYSGLQKIEVKGVTQEAVRIIYRDNDVLYVNINSLHKISKFTGKDGTQPKVHKLGSGVWEKLKNKTKKKVKDIAAELIKLYAKRKAIPGFAHQPDTYLQTELEASFIFEDTPDQSTATQDVKVDMEKESPMDRLVCGDVGFGKTEIAIRAAFKTVTDSKQAAILVPTTILAYQHYQNFSERLKEFPCTVDYINRFKTTKEKKETLKRLAEGKIDIIIGTHALLSKDVKYKDLGLLVIDEEQKFGVSAKEKIRGIKANVDTLTLTATPIPRTLQFSLMGARDLSIINTPPPNRQPVETEVRIFNEELIRDAIYYETERNGQVFFVHNRVKDLGEMLAFLKNLCPDVDFGSAHGQLKGNELEETILDFVAHKFDVLVCTNIVESGVDIPNANTIIINNAHQFGLSDLHQLRGRVGRSNKKAFCYLIAPPISTLPNESRKRLQSLEQFSELGSGFQIAMRDLDIRGAGNLLGGEQSGFISDIGLETFHKILNEAVRELKQKDLKHLFENDENEKMDAEDYVSDCTVDTDIEILIPTDYVESIQERLFLYHKLDRLEKEDDLTAFSQELEDRFGKIPRKVEDLFVALRCRWVAKQLGFEKLILRKKQLRLYFVSDPESPYFESAVFQHIMTYIQTKTNQARLKNVGKNFMLIIDKVNDLGEVLWHLQGMRRSKEESVVSNE
jgi:transcription-repair coupling factor (superfamily II helicase)